MGHLRDSRASLVLTCSLFGLCGVELVGGTTNCTIYGMSGMIVCIIPAKVYTCLARLRNTSGESVGGATNCTICGMSAGSSPSG